MYFSYSKILFVFLVASFLIAPDLVFAQLRYSDLVPVFDYRLITAQAAVVVDAKTGEVITAHNQDLPWRPASLTKLVTALVVLDKNPSLKGVAVMKKDDEVGGARLSTKAGVSYKVVDLMNATLIASTNNTANALARSTGLSRADFVAAMNAKAVQLGALHTVFVEPSGISENNYSTAADYAKIASAAFNNKTLSSISQKQKYQFTAYNNKRYKHNLTSTDKLLTDGGVVIKGGKTGYIDESRYNFVAHMQDVLGKNVVVVVFGSNSSKTEFAEAKQLALWSFDNHPWPLVAGANTNN